MNYSIDSTETVFKGRIMEVVVDHITYNGSGRASTREVVKKTPFVMVIPVLEDGRLVAIRQFRHPHQEMVIGFPAGLIDPGEEPIDAAKREMKEESGYVCKEIIPLGRITEVPEWAECVGHLFVATGLTLGDTDRDEGESTMENLLLTPTEFMQKIDSGEIPGVTQTTCFLRYLMFCSKKSPVSINNAEVSL
eukprot:TRINITY_DN66668_c8_g1_i1.p1 TRINITY_DN66668_c8_g1~~TRINITY_DN66668_c8_g1_i1.p1  ORF type:complete len:192 (+),score=23.06 TRINITY_DN66668_c8_g1_i1:84-659(+)